MVHRRKAYFRLQDGFEFRIRNVEQGVVETSDGDRRRVGTTRRPAVGHLVLDLESATSIVEAEVPFLSIGGDPTWCDGKAAWTEAPTDFFRVAIGCDVDAQRIACGLAASVIEEGLRVVIRGIGILASP